MNPILLALFNLYWHSSDAGTRPPDKARVRVWLVGSLPRGCTPLDLERMLLRSRHWIEIGEVVACSASACDDALGQAADGLIDVIAAGAPDVAQALLRRAESGGRTAFANVLPALGTDANNFVREVSHHDFENGGVNEWDGAPTRYSKWILQGLSAVHCESFFPGYALPSILSLYRQRGETPLSALDIGCGPMSRLGWGAVHGLLSVTGLDPLLEMYLIISCRHGHQDLPHALPKHSISLRAESVDLDRYAGAFDLIYTNNALDHTQDPAEVMRRMGRLIRPDGLFIAQVATDEGTRQKWDQLHQFNMRMEGPHFIAEPRSRRRITMAGPKAEWEIVQVARSSPESTVLVMRPGRAEA
jgi:SAM-dependent methyltransferase